MPSQPKNWVELENAVDAFLRERMKRNNCFAIRFYDSKSAGNYLPAQPSDFLAINNGKSIFIECKFSEVHDSLKSCFAGAVSANQTASAYLAKRAGARYVFLFYSARTGQYEIWDGRYCASRRSLGKPLETVKRLVFTNLESAILGGAFNNVGSHLVKTHPDK